MINKKLLVKVGLNVINIKPKKEINIIIRYNKNSIKEYRLRNHINYYFAVDCKNSTINIDIERVYGQIANEENEILEELSAFHYGFAQTRNGITYNISYSFDSNYYMGAFASIYSLIKNFDETKLKLLYLYLFIPEEDFESADINIKNFINITNNYNTNKINYTVIFVSKELVNDEFKMTKCYKGGNHLLKLSNFSRLIVCNFINSKNLLYLDSDTIIQSDMSSILDIVPEKNNFAFIGKKAELTFNNLINNVNTKHLLDFLGKDFDLNKNVIYTGTMILNTNVIKNNFNKMIELVKKHNDVEGGIYKLFTMSIINLGMVGNIGYFDSYLKNIADLGFKENLEEQIENSDVLDWSGMYKPWFRNGLYKEYWMKYNIMFGKLEKYVMYNKDTVETNLS